MDENYLIIYQGIGKKSKKPFECLKVKVGDYETLVFPSKIEMMYIKHILESPKDKQK